MTLNYFYDFYLEFDYLAIKFAAYTSNVGNITLLLTI